MDSEIVRFLIVLGLFTLLAFFTGCSYEIIHEWSGDDIPVTIDYPEYIIVSGNVGNVTYNIGVANEG